MGDGRLSKRLAVQCLHHAPYSIDEVAPSILLAPSKEHSHLATELMTDGRHCKLFSPKRPRPLALRVCGLNSVSERVCINQEG